MTTMKYLNAIFLLLTTFTILISFNTADALKCYQCESSEGSENCIKIKSDDLKDCPADGGATHCFTKSNDTNIIRGCISNPDTSCKDPVCFSCQGDGCNKNNICKFCNSLDTPDCSQTDVSNAKYNRVCKDDKTKCLMKINSTNKHTERRCVTDDNDDCKNMDENVCKVCNDANCNAGIFPPNRKNCFQCISSDTNCVNEQKDKGKICLLYAANDTCYSNADTATTMTRGCSSDEGTKCAKPNETKTCKVCNEDNCNTIALKRDQELKCVTCNSEADKKCINGVGIESKGCTNQIPFYEKDSCYKQIKESVVYRGCFFDRNTTELGDCNDNKNCTICTDNNGCNTEEQTCIICRSDIDPNCRKEINKSEGKPCRNQTAPTGDIECFTGKWNNVIIRGCLVDASPQDQFICNDAKNKQCLKCAGANCNYLRSAAAIKTIATSILMVTVLLLIERIM